MEGVTADDKAKATFGVGDAFATEKKYAEARGEYAKVVKMTDAKLDMRVEAQYNIGADYRAEGNFDMAKAEWAKILKMDGVSPEYKEKVEQRIRTVYW
jgi:tetratricopeptide (TPR) repeat protein